MKQQTISDVEYSARKRKTKREEFLEIMEKINISDDDLIKRIIKAYWFLDDDEKAAVKKMIDNLSGK